VRSQSVRAVRTAGERKKLNLRVINSLSERESNHRQQSRNHLSVLRRLRGSSSTGVALLERRERKLSLTSCSTTYSKKACIRTAAFTY
jgi:hypothetical protein